MLIAVVAALAAALPLASPVSAARPENRAVLSAALNFCRLKGPTRSRVRNGLGAW